MKRGILVRTILLALHVSSTTQMYLPSGVAAKPQYPTRTIANVTVVDTPLVREAAAFARQHSSDETWKHVMRGWLYGAALVAGNATLAGAVDGEVLAVANLLHDLGWDQTPASPVVSTDRRFEVDGAVAARGFLARHAGAAWDAARVQLVWDAIALHTQASIYAYKEPAVMAVGLGISMDFDGPLDGVPRDTYDGVLGEFPKVDFAASVSDTFTWLCRSKPATTYDTFMQPWGDIFVPHYSAKGHRAIDQIVAGTPST